MMEKTKRNLRMKFGESIIENREKIQSKDILKNIQTDDEVTQIKIEKINKTKNNSQNQNF